MMVVSWRAFGWSLTTGGRYERFDCMLLSDILVLKSYQTEIPENK